MHPIQISTKRLYPWVRKKESHNHQMGCVKFNFRARTRSSFRTAEEERYLPFCMHELKEVCDWLLSL